MRNLELFPLKDYESNGAARRSTRQSTFADNMKLPIHRWFRYSAGFSAEWVQLLLASYRGDSGMLVLDPFAGSGTTLLSADTMGVRAIGLEAHPFVCRVARAKLFWPNPVLDFNARALAVLDRARHSNGHEAPRFPTLITKCFPEVFLTELGRLKAAWEELNDGSPESELVWLAITSILRSTSTAGTAQWQYILPNKTKKVAHTPYVAYMKQVELMAMDMSAFQQKGQQPLAHLLHSDARHCPEIGEGSIDLVITSPPYANNYDYADALRFEMSFWGEVDSWADLHDVARKYLIPSSSQHASREKLDLDSLLESELLSAIRPEIAPVCRQLDAVRLVHAGNKHYHTMIAAYFVEMAKVWRELRRVCAPRAKVCFVIGDSAPYGVYVPVDKWLGELALAAGFREYSFEKLRDRNVKWRNRKHDVPLHEGYLWVKG